MSGRNDTIGLVLALSALLVALAFVTKGLLDIGSGDEQLVRSRITVSGMEEPGAGR